MRCWWMWAQVCWATASGACGYIGYERVSALGSESDAEPAALADNPGAGGPGQEVELGGAVSGPSHCTDGVLSGNEVTTDCGGACAPCATFTDALLAGSGSATIESALRLNDGSFIVAGHFEGNLTVPGWTEFTASSRDWWAARIAPDGSAIWARAWGSPANDSVASVALHPDGFWLLLGELDDDTSVDGTPVVVDVSDVVLAAFEFDGSLRWIRPFVGSDNDDAQAMDVTPAGDIVIVGEYLGSIDFGDGELNNGGSQEHAFIARLDAAGTTRWSRRVSEGGGLTRASTVAVRPDGFIEVGGRYYQFTFDGSSNPSRAGEHEVYIATLTADGQAADSPLNLQSSGNDDVKAIDFDVDGNRYMAGYAGGNLDIPGQADALPYNDGRAAWITSYTVTDALRFADAQGGDGPDEWETMLVDNNANEVVAAGPCSGPFASAGLGVGEDGLCVYAFGLDGTPRPEIVLAGTGIELNQMLIEPDGTRVLFGNLDGTLTLPGGDELTTASRQALILALDP